MKTGTWLKIIIVLFFIAFSAIFFVQNQRIAVIQFPFTGSFQIQLIYLMLIVFGLGVIATLFMSSFVASKIKKKALGEPEDEVLIEEDG